MTSTMRTRAARRPDRPTALGDTLPAVVPPRAGPTPTPDPGSGAGPAERGLGEPVAAARELLTAAVASLEPGRLTGGDAAELYGLFAAVERLSVAGKMLLAPRIDESGVWRDGGHRSPAAMLAELEGVPTGQARNTLDVGRRLPDLPGTEEALRSGTLSGPKAVELSGAAALDPSMELELLAGAGDKPLHEVKERCQRARATAGRRDPVAAVRRIHAARHFSSWTDAEGAFCYQGRDTADRGARILEQMQHTVIRLRRASRGSGAGTTVTGGDADATGAPPPVESERACRADAFFLLVTGRSPADRADGGSGTADRGGPGVGPAGSTAVGTVGGGDEDPGPSTDHIADPADDAPGTRIRPGGGPDDVIDRPPTCSLMVRVDLDALFRGETLPGEVCEIDTQGPIPVAMARDLADDSFLRVVFHRAGDIRAVSHLGRTINRRLRTALAYRDRCCVVPGCGVPFGLEIDHVVPFAQGGPTALDNLALLCHHHHYLKTYEGWTLDRTGSDDGGSPHWTFTPEPPFGQEPEPDSG